jgi:DNA-binding transcriptional regulator YhcF (GntR family)
MKIIHVKENLGLPKYRQIIQSVEKSLMENRLKIGDRLPSINKVCLEFSLSRDTVLFAYDDLKKRGIIYSAPGKGYYVKSADVNYIQHVFLLFDELNVFKEDLYNSLLNNLADKAKVDIYFHHFNLDMFKTLIENSHGNYTSYVIMPANFDHIQPYLEVLPRNSVYILDQMKEDLWDYPAVYQNFRKDMANALETATELLEKYKKLIMVFPNEKQPQGMLHGFQDFCSKYPFEHEVIREVSNRSLKTGEVYIMPSDRDLIQVIKKAKEQNLKIGIDIGVISYNDSTLKEVVHNGITTISTDFIGMGEKLAIMILENKSIQIENNCKLIVRESL